jgi:MFS transporter, MCT family, solute carrier family 16 (monocarboxylic acid transporters), member 10
MDLSISFIRLMIYTGASVVGRLTLGTCADRYNPWLLALATLSAASATVFVLWGVLARNVGGLIAFGIAYGVLAGGWSSLWTGFLK